MGRKRQRNFGFGFLPTVILVFVVAAIALAAIGYVRSKNSTGKLAPENEQSQELYENSLKLHFIDVGQADSTLIESKDGKFMLVDAGTYDSGRKICDYLNANGVEELEYVIFTHPHEDHIGAGVRVLENFDVKNVIMTQKASNSSTYERLVDKLLECKSAKGTKIISPNVREVYELDGASFEILSADGENEDSNNSSIVFRLTYGKCSFMFTGDAEKQIERKVLRLGENLNSVLLKCGHHGSSTSTSEEFLKAVKPKCAIISCGLDNSYGHPHVETIEALNDINATVYRTDEMGDIVMYCDGKLLYFGKASKAS